jgi:acetylglutamate kinase
MKYVVKLGGATIEDKKLLHACGKAISELVRDGNQVAVVHGGGKQLTETLAQMGKKSEFISGLRITDAETRDAALMVLAGRVNKSLVAALGSHGQAAMGLSGGDGHVFRARKKKTLPDLGFVGEIAATDPRWLDAIWKMDAVPVISRSRWASTASTTTSTPTRWPPPAPSAPTPTRWYSSPTFPASRARTAR